MNDGLGWIGGGALTILGTALNLIWNRRKLGADTASVLSRAATNLVQPLSDQIDRLEKKVKELEGQVATAKQSLASAMAELDACHDLNRHKDDLIAALTREQPQN